MDYYSRGSFSLCEYSGDSEAAAEAEEYWFLPPHAASAAAVPEDNDQLEAAEGSSDAESGCYGEAWPWPPTDLQVDDEDAPDAAVLPGAEGTSFVRGWTRAGVFTVVSRINDGTGAACDEQDDDGGDEVATWTGRSAEVDRREDDRLFWESCLLYGYSADS